MKINFIVVVVSAMVCGVAVGWFLKPSDSPYAEVGTDEIPHASKRVDDAGGDSAREALRRRVKELERELAAAKAARPLEAPLEVNAPTGEVNRIEAGQRRHGPPSAADFRKHMEEIRKNDPERYTRMTNSMARFRTHALRRAANRLDVLASVDTSRMTAQETEVHQKLQDVIAREQELHEIANPSNEDTTDEERAAAWKEMRELHHQKRELEEAERNTLLAQTAEAYGLSGDDAVEMVETVKAVYQATQSNFGPPHGRGGPGGHRR